MGNYRVVVKAKFNEGEELFEFDVVNDVGIETRSEITEHPIVSGDMIADHMYRRPISMSVSGVFSDYGNKRQAYDGVYGRLGNIEHIFEKIKNEGVFCDVMRLSADDNQSIKYLERKNMVIDSISWKHVRSTLVFTFGFTEVLLSSVAVVDYTVDDTDPNLPALTDPLTLDFTDNLLDWSAIDEIIIKILHDNKLITLEFIKYIAEAAGAGALIGLAVGVAGGIATLTIVSAVCGGLAFVPVAGWIAAAVVAGVAIIAGLIAGIVKGLQKGDAQKKYRIKAFELYKDDRKNEAEVIRFLNYIGTIHQNLEYLEDVMQVYGIGSDQNQELLLYIDNNYYIFTFMKNSATGYYALKVTDIDGNVMGEQSIIDGLPTLAECNDSNYIFRTIGGGFYVYLMNLNGFEQNELRTLNEAEEVESLQNLTNYAILISQVNMKNFNQMLEEIIDNAMRL